jgi:molybdopterin synthase catalytic subunit
MALKKMNEIGNEMVVKYGLEGIAIMHRTGEVPVTETSVVIVTVSAHRKAAIEACAEAIDLLKEKVPIWKKEFYSEGDPSWKQNPESVH